MSPFLFRKGGTPAIASSLVNNALVSCLGSLVIQVNAASKQATVELHFKVPVQGLDLDQRISLIYDGDNLEPGKSTVGDATVSSAIIEHIVRSRESRGSHKLKSLRLVLGHPCVVLCSLSGSITPKPGSGFEQLALLARATQVDIVFDSAFLHPDKAAQLNFLTGTSALVGFRRNSAAAVTEADWTIFSPCSPAPPETPPPYDEAPLKRSRQASSSSPQAPSTKRILLDPNAKIDPGSPTEKATTTTEVSSPVLDPYPADAASFDPFQDAVETAVVKILPQALKEILPGILTEIMPEILMRTFALPASTPQPQTTPPPPNPMSPLHRLIRNHLNNRAEELAKEITSDTHGHALYLRETADVELEERLDEHRLELAALQEDGLMEIHRVYDTKLEQLEERTRELVETVELESSEAYTTAKERLDWYVSERRLDLVKEALKIERPRKENPATAILRAKSVPLDLG